MPLTTVLFDMDGILVDSEAYWFAARIEYAAALGKPWTLDDQRAAMGRNTIEWAHVMQERLHLPDTPLDSIMTDVTDRVIAKITERLPLLPGAVEAVHTAAERHRVALASGSPTRVIETVMRLTGLDRVFEVMVFGDTIPRGKPNPDIWLAACERLGVTPADCLGIEDSGNGVRSLHAAGIYAIAVPSPGFPLAPEVLALAQRQLPDLMHFTPALLDEIGAVFAAGTP